MSLKIEIETRPEAHALEVAAQIPLWKIPKTLGPAYEKIHAFAAQHDVTLDGAPFARYLNLNWTHVRTDSTLKKIWQLLTHKQKMRIGMPVAEAVSGAGDIEGVTDAPGKFVKTTHLGPYHKLDQTYRQLAQWAHDKDVALVNAVKEHYVNDPANTPAKDLETLIFVRVAD